MNILLKFFRHAPHITRQLIVLALIGSSLGLLATTRAVAQQIGIEQSSEFLITSTGVKFLRWHGKPNHTYFIQVSSPTDHLVKWSYAPIIETGNDQEISHEATGTAEKGFFRLHYTDQAIPSGKTVETADFDGDGLTNSQEIEPPFLSIGTSPLNWDTDGDGLSDGFERTHGFDPNDGGTSDPNQSPLAACRI